MSKRGFITTVVGCMLGSVASGAQWLSLERYGNGSDGAWTPGSGTFSEPVAGCWGTSTTTQLNLDSAPAFVNGNMVLIHQTRGSNVGAWELNKVVSGGGSTTLTLAYPLSNTYTDGGSNQSQVIRLKQYSAVTINGGVIVSAPEWAGNTGGIIAFLCNGTVTVNGTLRANGAGFIGGWPGNGGDSRMSCGEGSGQDRVQNTANPAGNGGGGYGVCSTGGGNAEARSSCDNTYADVEYNSSLTRIGFGGGGGGGSSGNTGNGAGGDGGGMILILAKNLVIGGSISAAGNNGANAGTERAGSGGAGGCVLMKVQSATLGANLVSAARGIKGTGGCCSNHTDGSIGRIHLDYATSYTGATDNPLLTVTQDPNLIANDRPSTFALTAPTHGATLTDPRPSFAWETSTDPEGQPVRYLLRLSRDATFTDPIFRQTEHSSTTFSVPAGMEIENGTYYWKVIASDGEATRDSTDTRSFTMSYSAPTTPAITAIEGNPADSTVTRIAGTVDPSEGTAVTLYQWDGQGEQYLAMPGTVAWLGSCFTIDPQTPIASGTRLFVRTGDNDADSRTAIVDFSFVQDVFADEQTVHGGSGRSLRLEGDTAYRFKLVVNGGQAVTVTAWVRRNAAYTGTMPAISLSGSEIAGVSDTATGPADTWEQLSVSGTPDADGVLSLTFESFSTAAGAAAWIDDIDVSQ